MKVSPEEAAAMREAIGRATEAMVSLAKKIVAAVKRFSLTIRRFIDELRAGVSDLIEEYGRGWEFPELVLTDDQRDGLVARAFGRTLEEIDALPVV